MINSIKTVLILFVVIAIISCEKEEDRPVIGYKFWEPNINVTDTLTIDLDSDGTNDLQFSLRQTTGNYGATDEYLNVRSVNSHFFFSLGKSLTNETHYDCIMEKETINDDLTWIGKEKNGLDIRVRYNTSNDFYLDSGIWDWFDNDEYIGLKFTSGQFVRYGWLKMETDISTSENVIKLKSMAFTINNYKAIQAGQLK